MDIIAAVASDCQSRNMRRDSSRRPNANGVIVCSTLMLMSLLAGRIGFCNSPKALPNIVFFLADDLRPDGLHSLGNTIVKTPNLDRLVERGFIFRSAYVLGSNVGAVLARPAAR